MTSFLISFSVHLKIIGFNHVYVSSPLQTKTYKSAESPQSLWVQIEKIYYQKKKKKTYEISLCGESR